ncbi:hypothetical protein GPECTOR_7g1162 [Gonium pectorale]|uniref:Uncharacterized protein n=1 Tax=Gonium pectorale TaxID=33097 RepID=A0A150GUA1_GONPE|nr:hypothetical protein GPECTOR_7g1162 [Gonium pectorale]|eukprot:KXZ53268.1 hypothetical protein GPECTOR_7g1162 [Gonium pectorale]
MSLARVTQLSLRCNVSRSEMNKERQRFKERHVRRPSAALLQMLGMPPAMLDILGINVEDGDGPEEPGQAQGQVPAPGGGAAAAGAGAVAGGGASRRRDATMAAELLNLRFLSGMTALTRLRLAVPLDMGARLGGGGLSYLSGLTRLKRLDLLPVSRLRSADLAPLAALGGSLEHLELYLDDSTTLHWHRRPDGYEPPDMSNLPAPGPVLLMGGRVMRDYEYAHRVYPAWTRLNEVLSQLPRLAHLSISAAAPFWLPMGQHLLAQHPHIQDELSVDICGMGAVWSQDKEAYEELVIHGPLPDTLGPLLPPSLRRLSLANRPGEDGEQEGSSQRKLAVVQVDCLPPGLEALDMQNMTLTGTMPGSGLPALSQLSLHCCALANLEQLAMGPRLRRLQLFRSSIGDSRMGDLVERCPGIVELNLQEAFSPDPEKNQKLCMSLACGGLLAGLHHIGRLSQLESLSLPIPRSCEDMSAMVPHLAALPSLHSLLVQGLWDVAVPSLTCLTALRRLEWLKLHMVVDTRCYSLAGPSSPPAATAAAGSRPSSTKRAAAAAVAAAASPSSPAAERPAKRQRRGSQPPGPRHDGALPESSTAEAGGAGPSSPTGEAPASPPPVAYDAHAISQNLYTSLVEQLPYTKVAMKLITITFKTPDGADAPGGPGGGGDDGGGGEPGGGGDDGGGGGPGAAAAAAAAAALAAALGPPPGVPPPNVPPAAGGGAAGGGPPAAAAPAAGAGGGGPPGPADALAEALGNIGMQLVMGVAMAALGIPPPPPGMLGIGPAQPGAGGPLNILGPIGVAPLPPNLAAAVANAAAAAAPAAPPPPGALAAMPGGLPGAMPGGGPLGGGPEAGDAPDEADDEEAAGGPDGGGILGCHVM